MLDSSLKPIGFDTWGKETWEEYRNRLGLPDEEAVLQFYRQVVYDHFEHFNEHYPEFNLGDYQFLICELSAQEASDRIRFFNDEVMNWWGEQYDDFEKKDKKYVIFQAMSKSRTFPFPPILVDPELLAKTGGKACGKPIHLIEGTHRVSYLRHMLARGLISPTSKHKFVLLKPNFQHAGI